MIFAQTFCTILKQQRKPIKQKKDDKATSLMDIDILDILDNRGRRNTTPGFYYAGSSRNYIQYHHPKMDLLYPLSPLHKILNLIQQPLEPRIY